jgi:hypothetical protein
MKRTGGGAATAGGMDFQHRISAWMVVQVLAEKDGTLPWNLSTGMTLEWIQCETQHPLDDLQVFIGCFSPANKINLIPVTDPA